MNTEKLLQIKLTKIINAPRWKVIRLLTRVWTFSEFIPTIDSVEILEKKRNVVKTKWRILVDELPINWIEEDTLNLNEHAIYFKSVEGDLEDFHGVWHFEEHPEGTEVKVEVYLSSGIPVIKDLMEDYLKTLVTRNFEAILDTLEHQLISQKYTSLKKGDINKVAGFGLIGHFYNFSHLERGLKMLNPDFNAPSVEFLSKLFDVTPSFKMYDTKDYKSKAGDAVNGCIILCTFVPDMIDANLESVYRKVVRACKLAEKNGVGIVTLGGFTSIVAERFGNRILEEVDIPITTGNTFAAALAVEGVEKAIKLLTDKALKNLKATVIGGTGDVGSACARSLTEKVKQVTITGRSRFNLYKLKHELKKKKGAAIEASRNNEKAVKDADIVIAAANSSSSIINIDWFKPGAIVCDLAYPKNISYNAVRKDIFVFSGGLASVPSPIDLSVMMGLPSANICYGCSCEAIVLAFEKRFENFSFGRGKIMPDKMEEILAMGKKHGFELAPFFWADKIVENEVIDEIKEALKHG